MAQTGYTPIYLYNSGTTTNVPTNTNLGSGELAINYTDGKYFAGIVDAGDEKVEITSVSLSL